MNFYNSLMELSHLILNGFAIGMIIGIILFVIFYMMIKRSGKKGPNE